MSAAMATLWVVDTRDNVATVIGGDLEGSSEASIVGSVKGTLEACEAVPYGHKVALGPLSAGSEVIKYGAVIGVLKSDVAAGGYIHVHNLTSLRGRGDLKRVVV